MNISIGYSLILNNSDILCYLAGTCYHKVTNRVFFPLVVLLPFFVVLVVCFVFVFFIAWCVEGGGV